MFKILTKPEGSKIAELSLKQREMYFAYKVDAGNRAWPTIHEALTDPTFRVQNVKSESKKREGKLRTIVE